MAERTLFNPQGQPVINPQTGSPFVLSFPDTASPDEIQAGAQRAFATMQQQLPEVAEAIRMQAQPLAGAAPSGIPAAGRMVGEMLKQEALPIALQTAATAALGPGAGLATRAATAGGAGLLGMLGTRGFRGQPVPTLGEAGLEVGLGAAPEAAVSVFQPNRAQRLMQETRALTSKRLGRPVPAIGAVVPTAEITEPIGRRLRLDVGRIRGQLGKEKAAKYDAVRSQADRLNLSGSVSDASQDALGETFTIIDTDLKRAMRPVIDPATGKAVKEVDPETGKLLTVKEVQAGKQELQRLHELLKEATVAAQTGRAVPLSTLSEINLLASSRARQFRLTGAPTERQLPFQQLRTSLRRDIENIASGTPVERTLREANDFLVNEFDPTIDALKVVEGAGSPETVVQALASADPGQLRRLFARADQLRPGYSNEMRDAFFLSVLEESRDAAGIINPAMVVDRWARLSASSKRTLAAGPYRQMDKLMEGLGEEMSRLRIAGQFRLAQATTLSVGIGKVGSTLAEGGFGSAIPWLLGTAAGVRVLSKIMSDSSLRRLVTQGLDSRRVRLVGAVIDRAITDIVAEESRLPEAQSSPAIAQQP